MEEKSLYKMKDEALILAEMLDDETADTESIAKRMIELDGQIDQKAQNTLNYMLNLASARDGAKAEAKRLNEYSDHLDRRYNRLKDGLMYCMKELGKTTILTEHGEIKIKLNPPSVIIDDVAELPAEYQRREITIKPNKKAIQQALKAGKEVKGAHFERKEVLVF